MANFDPELEAHMRNLSMRLRASQEETMTLEVQRNELVATMINAGYSTYQIAELAGIKQPRVVQINNVQRGGTQYHSIAPRGAMNQPRKTQ